MTVLIIDDEAHVVEAVQLLVPWQKYGIERVLTAFSVPEASDILESEQPDIVIVDVVIGEYLGIEILKHIQTNHMNTRSIVISGYDDFQYTRAMFLLGAIDYLLKPIVPEELENAVAKAVEQVLHDQQSNPSSFGLDKQLKHLFPDHQHSLFRKLFQKELRPVAYEELCRINASVMRSEKCIVLHGSGIFLPIFSQNYVIALSEFLNTLQHELEIKAYGTLFQRSQPDPDVVILLYNHLDDAFSLVKESCQTFIRASGSSFRLGASPRMPFVDGLDEAWAHAIDANDAIDWESGEPIRLWTPDTSSPSLKYDHKHAKEICSALLTGDKASFEAAFSAWLNTQLAEQPHTCGTLRCLRSLFLKLYEQDCKNSGFETHSLLTDFSEYCSPDWETTLSQITQESKRRLWNLVTTKSEENNWIQDVAEYLELNYAQKFSQQKCADLFHVNKDYMSRHFRKTYGVGMVTYLTEIRLRKAKELLRASSLQIQEIADQVGFFDVKYFSIQFKKETGLTPSAFRTLNGNED